MRKVFVITLIASIVLFGFPSCKSKKKPTKKAKTTQKHIVKQSISASGNDNKKLYKVVNEWLGTPYKYGGCDKKGTDCSCLVLNIYKEVYGIDLYRSAYDIMKNVFFVEKNQIKEGDILFFITNKNKTVSHVGIYLKDNLFIHSSTSKGVILTNLDEPYYVKAFYKAGRHQKVP